MYPVQQANTSQVLLFLMTDSVDHISPKTGLSPTVLLSKNGAAFAACAGAVSEVGDGWYKVAANATDAGTLGPLLLHATATGADPQDVVFTVVTDDPLSSLCRIDGKVAGLSGSVVFQGPVAPGGRVTIRRGYSYESAYGTALQWTCSGWVSLAGATLQLWDNDLQQALGTISYTSGGGSQTVTVQLTSSATLALEAAAREYVLRATFGSEIVPLAIGIIQVLEG